MNPLPTVWGLSADQDAYLLDYAEYDKELVQHVLDQLKQQIALPTNLQSAPTLKPKFGQTVKVPVMKPPQFMPAHVKHPSSPDYDVLEYDTSGQTGWAALEGTQILKQIKSYKDTYYGVAPPKDPDEQAIQTVATWRYANLLTKPPYPGEQGGSVHEMSGHRVKVEWDTDLVTNGEVLAGGKYSWWMPQTTHHLYLPWGVGFWNFSTGPGLLGVIPLKALPREIEYNVLTVTRLAYTAETGWKI